MQIIYGGVQQKTINSFEKSKAEGGAGAEDDLSPLFEKPRIWQIVEFCLHVVGWVHIATTIICVIGWGESHLLVVLGMCNTLSL